MQRKRIDLPCGETSDEAYCISMFSRACMEGDQCAQSWIERHFREMVLGWLRRYPYKDAAYASHPEEYYVTATFERLYRVAKQFPLPGSELSSYLRLMQACMSGVIGDVLRDARASLLQAQVNVIDEQEIRAGSKLWEYIQKMLPTSREQRLAYLLYVCGLKPGEIVQRLPREFSDLEEINQLRRAILERLEQVTRMN